MTEFKELIIDKYDNYYRVDAVSCKNQPIAGAAGYYNFYNYMYYCFYLTLSKNWNNDIYIDENNYINTILSKLGLQLKEYSIEDYSNLVPFIKDKIDSNIPLLIMCRRNSIFFSQSYMDDNANSLHGLLIMGYSLNSPLLILRDVTHIESSGIDFEKYNYGLYKLFLKEKYIVDIWKETNELFKKEENKNYYNKIFTIEQIGAPTITSYIDLVKDTIKNYDFSNSKFAEEIKKYDTNCKESYVVYLRKAYCNSLQVFFDIINRSFNDIKNTDQYIEFIDFTNKFYKNRYNLISLLHIKTLRCEKLEENQREKLVNDILFMDNKLYKKVEEIYKFYCNYMSISKDELRDFAKEAKISADSETYFGPAIDCVDDNENSLWHTCKQSLNHWIIFEFNKKVIVSKFLIKHAYNKLLVTKDFLIQGSNDNKNWINLVKCNNNTTFETVHKIQPSEFRFIKLVILYPCLNDFNARIHKFEIWGK